MKFFPEKLSIKWITQAYDSEELTPYELADEIIRRAEKFKEKNIWITAPTKELMEKYISKLPSRSKNMPLWGMPFAIKDNIDLENVATTAACPGYAYIPQKNAFVVQKLIEAGAFPVGKTNLDQFATGLVGTRSPYGEVYNAYDSKMISGGSSSGSAVSVALGMAAFSLGTDTAGSGRVPAMLNTLVGFKPSLGSWSTSGVVPACASLDCVTVFANSLEDAQLVDKYAKGYDALCSWSKEYDEKNSSILEKIYLPKEEPQFFGDNADIHRTKWHCAVNRIKKLGVNIHYIDYQMFYDAAKILYDGAYVAERWADLKGFVSSNQDKVFPVTREILSSGGTEDKTASKLFNDLHKLQYYKHRTKELLKNAVMIMPTAGGTFTRDQVRNDPINTNSYMGLYTNHCNLLDLMAVAVPENTKDRNLPFGITIFGLADNTNLVMETAEKFINSESIEFAVCGLHKKGFMLESQLIELGAEYIESTITTKAYKLYRLNTDPVKPGLVRTSDGGENICVDVFRIPVSKLGSFIENVKPPLLIGNIELDDSRIVKGFLCEEYALNNAEDITCNKKF
ncbi:MAG: allophanate hydrolase [Ruminococcus flavefaciens]|nr:allophanate hydrolase [Ruminococcus flavefaciens]MCM1061704.1 allophanate hydrolase [Eubacterium sp.]